MFRQLPVRPSGPAALVALAAGLALGSAACGAEDPTPPPRGVVDTGRPTLNPAYVPSGHMAAGDVFVHLFEWRWADVATECETVLGPAGYDAVQVSPPQEHAVLPVQGHPWWQRYQPVSYTLESRSGDRAAFADMVARCADAGIGIYVDAVINHMTAGAGTGSAGTSYTKYAYPGLWSASDFHPPCEIQDWQDEAQVQDCELLGLSDLETGDAAVRARLAAYLLDLARLGVAGFRIDAAKHMQPVELDSIVATVHDALAADGLSLPYWFGEVIDYGGEAVEARDYFGLGYASGGVADVTEFRYRGIGDKFIGLGGQHLAELDPAGPPGARFTAAAWGLIPADKAVVFVENHDTQRGGGISYRDGDAYRLANFFMLAHPYGHPKVMSSYAFDRTAQAGRDAGPPSNAGVTRPVTCAATLEAATSGDWVCEHRDPAIAAMVRFREVVASEPLVGWWDDGDNAIAFSRGARGFVALSRHDAEVTIATTTMLPAGTYCDVLSGGTAPDGGCAGRTVAVGAGGAVEVTLDPDQGVAIHLDSMPDQP